MAQRGGSGALRRRYVVQRLVGVRVRVRVGVRVRFGVGVRVRFVVGVRVRGRLRVGAPRP